MKNLIRTVVVVFFAWSCTGAVRMSAQSIPAPLLLNGPKLAEIKRSYAAGEKTYRDAVKRTLREAEKALKMKPVSVTEKKQLPPSGDRHDYMSLAGYWWPDPKSKDGLPYIRRDGVINDERDQIPDRASFGRLNAAVSSLALGYFLTGNEEFAEHATLLLSVWFLDSATGMNPNLNYSQAVQGRNVGRGAGLIEMHTLPRILDAVTLLRGSTSWTEAKDRSFVAWCSRYYEWLTTNAIGLNEKNAANNHGSWYDVQRVSIALFLGKREEARNVLVAAKQRRIGVQIEPDGRQPKELVRTKALGYSTFNLIGLATLATIGRSVGVDLWHYATPEGRSIRKAIDFLIPYYEGKREWEYQQIASFNISEAVQLLSRAGANLDPAYVNAANAVRPSGTRATLQEVLY